MSKPAPVAQGDWVTHLSPESGYYGEILQVLAVEEHTKYRENSRGDVDDLSYVKIEFIDSRGVINTFMFWASVVPVAMTSSGPYSTYPGMARRLHKFDGYVRGEDDES